MISNELLEEVIYTSSKNKNISKNLIKKIILDTVSNTDDYTKDTFNGIIFNDIGWCRNAVCACRIDSKEIIVDYQKLLKFMNKKSILNSNLEIIVNLLHEVEHLKEQGKIEKLGLESFLLYYSSLEIFQNLAEEKLGLMKNILPKILYDKRLEREQDKIYLKIYDKNPSERLATIYSHKLLVESLQNYEGFKEKYKNCFKYINKLYISQYYMGYRIKKSSNDLNIPLVDYFNFIGMTEFLYYLDFYNSNYKEFLKSCSKEFSIEERMLYGLPVTLEETKELDKKLILTKQ